MSKMFAKLPAKLEIVRDPAVLLRRRGTGMLYLSINQIRTSVVVGLLMPVATKDDRIENQGADSIGYACWWLCGSKRLFILNHL